MRKGQTHAAPLDDAQLAKLYRLRLAMDLMNVRGTLTAELTNPLADVSPALKTIVTLDEFLVTQ